VISAPPSRAAAQRTPGDSIAVVPLVYLLAAREVSSSSGRGENDCALVLWA
jgi:hypothetical protein